LEQYNTLLAIFVFLFGISVGSFLNVLIYRVPKGINISFPPSKCTSCDTKLEWYHNIPLLSWLALKGQCAFCKEKIAARYPLVELSNGLIWLLLFYKIGLLWYLPFVALSFSMLLALTLIDLEYYAVPDTLNIAALIFALISPTFSSSIIDATFAAVGFYTLGLVVSKLAKKDALGEADIIVAATMAALLGYPAFFIAMFISALIAIIPSILAKDTIIPFVPFLAIATLITYLNKEWLLSILKDLMYG
jgi:leader peptidase (prepilin peptidase)/N-methyltransferase